MDGFMTILLIIHAVTVVIPTVGFALIGLLAGFPRIRIGQVAGIVAATAWVLGFFTMQYWELGRYLALSVIATTLAFFALWRREFRLLMLRRDDEFPGRFDKVGWFLMLTLAAPAGVWLFRSFRAARWPEPKGDARPSRRNPWDMDDEQGADALAGAGTGRVE